MFSPGSSSTLTTVDNNDPSWSMDLISAMPKGVLETQAAHHSYCAGAASRGLWHCLATQYLHHDETNNNHNNDVHYTLYLWYAPPNYSPEEQKHQTPFLKLSHWQLENKLVENNNNTDNKPNPPLLALQVSPQNQESVYVYAANPTSGALVLWRISREDLRRPIAPPNSALVSIPIHGENDDDNLPEHHHGDMHRDDYLTCLTVSYPNRAAPPVILLGTAAGRTYWVQQTHIPIGLHVQKVDPSPAPVGGSFFTRLLSSSLQASANDDYSEDSPIVTHLALKFASTASAAVSATTGNRLLEDDSQVEHKVDDNSSPAAAESFLSLTQAGRIVAWTVTPTESHRAFFACKQVLQLQEAFLQLDEKNSNNHHHHFTKVEVLCATWNGPTQQLHLLFHAFYGDDTTPPQPPPQQQVTTCRLYWARLSVVRTTTTLTLDQVVWLNRFADPHQDVRVAGLQATDNGLAYAVFTVEPDQNSTIYAPHSIQLGHPARSSHTTIVMVMDIDSATAQVVVHESEVRLPRSVATILPGTMSKDTQTHGVSVWDTSGMRVRMRWKMDRRAVAVTAPSSGNPLLVHKLILHLRSYFWDSYRHPDRTIRVPPSLTEAGGTADLEQAIVAFGKELQNKGSVTSQDNILEWHLVLVDLLQQSGIYRSLSSICRWKLLAIGQQVSVFSTLCAMPAGTLWEQAQLRRLTPSGVAEWLEGVQASIGHGGGGEEQESTFLQWLCRAVDDALLYRANRASDNYDLSFGELARVSTPDKVPVWTNHPSLRMVWDRQLEKWKVSLSTASQTVVETVTAFILQSCSDSFFSCPNAETKESYTTVQTHAFELLRKVNGWKKDRFVFDLCVTHRFFSGLCEIALDHERRGDRATFALDPLFEKLVHETDVGSGMRFPVFVLKWHTERAHFGHVLKYGKHCPDDLNVLMNNDAALQPFRWIHAVRKGDYDSASTCLLENASSSTSKLPDTLRALSCASIANRVVEAESTTLKAKASKRSKLIDRKRELAIAQDELLGDSASSSCLLPPDRLLEIVLQKFEAAKDPAIKADILFTGLAICSGGFVDSPQDTIERAVKIWYNAITADMDSWHKWIQVETDLADTRLRDLILDETVFGTLLQQTQEQQSETWDDVVFGPQVENGVLAILNPIGSESGRKMHRLLRSVAAKHA